MSRILKQLGSVIVVFALVLVTFGFASPAHAGYLVRGAKIVNVQNTSSNGSNFAIKVVGGEGPCSGKVIIFPEKAVPYDVYKRGYAIALAAMKNDWSVGVYDYSGDSCRNGGQLSVSK